MNMNGKAQKSLVWLLVKTRLLAQTGLNTFRYEKDSRKKTGKVMIFVAIIMCLCMVVVYSGAIAYGYSKIGLSSLIPLSAMIISSLFTLVFSIFKTNGEFFAFKDFDMILSLPVPIRTVINSRFLNMYLWNTFITMLIVIPMGSIYALTVHPSASYYIMWISSLLVISLIPTTIAAIFGALLTAIASKFRYASAVSTILSLFFVIGILVLSMSITPSNSGLGSLFDPVTGEIKTELISSMAPVISDSMTTIYPPAKLYQAAILDGDWISYLLFAGISILWYALFVYALSIKYREINTALTSHFSRSDYKVQTLYRKSMLSALYQKTIMRILKSTICATNMLVGCIMAVLMAIAFVAIGPEKVLSSMELSASTTIIKDIAPYIIAALVTMTNTACVSLALEGKNIWQIKSLPISPKTLYDSYILVNLTFTVPTALICGILFSIALETSFLGTILMLVTPLAFTLLFSVFGIFIGNRMAYYDWQEEVQLIKQSLMSMIGMLGGMMFTAACGFIVNAKLIPVNTNLLTLLLDAVVLVIAAGLYVHEMQRPVKE